MRKLKIKPADIIIPAAVLLIALIVFICAKVTSGSGTAEIIHDGELVETIDLSSSGDRTIEVEGVEIKAGNGKIAVVSSDCYGQDCVRTGEISEAGETIVCAPNKIFIRITGSSSKAPDAISY